MKLIISLALILVLLSLLSANSTLNAAERGSANMQNISKLAQNDIRLSEELKEFFRVTKNSAIICRYSSISACYWKVHAVPLRYHRGLEQFTKQGIPAETFERNLWQEYGFLLHDYSVLSNERVDWLKSVSVMVPGLASDINEFLECCKKVVSEQEQVSGQIEFIVARQNEESHKPVEKGGFLVVSVDGKGTKPATSELRHVFIPGLYDFIVPESKWSYIQTIGSRSPEISVKKAGVMRVYLSFRDKNSAESYCTTESGCKLSEVTPFTSAASMKREYDQDKEALFSCLPIGSKFDWASERVHIPHHYVVEQEFCYGEISASGQE